MFANKGRLRGSELKVWSNSDAVRNCGREGERRGVVFRSRRIDYGQDGGMHSRAGWGGRGGGGGNLPLNLCEKNLWGQPIRGWVTPLSSRLVNPVPHDNSRALVLNEGVSSHTATRASLTSGLCASAHKTHKRKLLLNNGLCQSSWKDDPVAVRPDKMGKIQVIYSSWAQSHFNISITSPWRCISRMSSSSAIVQMCVLTGVRL